jgi:hypothetical protein
MYNESFFPINLEYQNTGAVTKAVMALIASPSCALSNSVAFAFVKSSSLT